MALDTRRTSPSLSPSLLDAVQGGAPRVPLPRARPNGDVNSFGEFEAGRRNMFFDDLAPGRAETDATNRARQYLVDHPKTSYVIFEGITPTGQKVEGGYGRKDLAADLLRMKTGNADGLDGLLERDAQGRIVSHRADPVVPPANASAFERLADLKGIKGEGFTFGAQDLSNLAPQTPALSANDWDKVANVLGTKGEGFSFGPQDFSNLTPSASQTSVWENAAQREGLKGDGFTFGQQDFSSLQQQPSQGLDTQGFEQAAQQQGLKDDGFTFGQQDFSSCSNNRRKASIRRASNKPRNNKG